MTIIIFIKLPEFIPCVEGDVCTDDGTGVDTIDGSCDTVLVAIINKRYIVV